MAAKVTCKEVGETERTVVLKMSSTLIMDWKDIIDTATLVVVAGKRGVMPSGVVTVMGALIWLPEKAVMTVMEPE